jgi:hypothetical protein
LWHFVYIFFAKDFSTKNYSVKIINNIFVGQIYLPAYLLKVTPDRLGVRAEFKSLRCKKLSIKIFNFLIVAFLILFVVNIDSQAVGQQGGNQSGFTVTHGPDFDRPLVPTESGYDFPKALEPKGYQSTATIEAKFYKDGVVQTITEPVTWTIEDVQNSVPSWNRASKAKNGLVWGDTVNP